MSTEQNDATLRDEIDKAIERLCDASFNCGWNDADGSSTRAANSEYASALAALRSAISTALAPKWKPFSTVPNDDKEQIIVAHERAVFSCSVFFAKNLSPLPTAWQPLPAPALAPKGEG